MAEIKCILLLYKKMVFSYLYVWCMYAAVNIQREQLQKWVLSCHSVGPRVELSHVAKGLYALSY